MDLTQYIEAGTRGGAARPRWAVNVGWEGCHGPSPRCRGGSLSLAMRGGGFSGSKSRYAMHISHLSDRSITKSLLVRIICTLRLEDGALPA